MNLPIESVHPKDRIKWAAEAEVREQYYSHKFKVVANAAPSVIAEIGVNAGYSAFCFLTAAPRAKYYGFDNDSGTHGGVKGMYKWARQILKPFDAIIRIDFNTQKNEYLIDGCGQELKADFVHIDGDHSFEGCFNDLELAEKTGAAVILVDDYDYIPLVKDAVSLFVNQNSLFTCEVISDLKGQAILKRKDYGARI